MAALKGIFLFFWRNPYAAIALLVAAGYGFMKWQGYRIEGLRLEKVQLEQTLKLERNHNEKVVKAFDDKGVKDAERNEFKRKAAASVAGNPDPVRAAYFSVYERAHGEAAASSK